MIRYILFGIVALFFMGCAPQYAIKTIYIPPKDKMAHKCLNRCNLERSLCQKRCMEQKRQCLNDAFARAKDIEAIEEQKYQKNLALYQEKLSDYNYKIFDWQNLYDQNYKDWRYFRKKCKTSHDSYACDREDDLRRAIDILIRKKPKEPKAPLSPSFSKILSKEQSFCRYDCGCQKDYDICFSNCGGEIEVKKICIENCDKK